MTRTKAIKYTRKLSEYFILLEERSMQNVRNNLSQKKNIIINYV